MKKNKPRNLKQTTTQMEKQTQVREIATNTNRSVNYMPQPSDGAPCAVTLIPGDGIGPLVTGAVEWRRMLRESWRNRFDTMRLRLSWRSSTFDEKLTRSLIYKPISSPSPPSDPSTDLAAIRPTRQSHCCHPLPLSFSQSISPSPSLTINAYFLGRLNFFVMFFLLIWFIYSDFLL